MRKTDVFLGLSLALALGGCSSNGGSSSLSPQPPITNGPGVPASVKAVGGYRVTVFAAAPSGSTKPDSIVQIGHSVFVAFSGGVNPDGTPGASGKATSEIVQYDLTGTVQKTFTVPGHNDGLMEFDSTTLWAMSNEDANPKLVVIDIASGSARSYTARPSLLNGSGGLPHGGGLDDMQSMNGKVYVSGSNPTVSATAGCASDSSTPGCPNGVSAGVFAYALTLDAGSTFDLAPIASSNTSAANAATNASGTLNMTDPDSEVVTPDGSTLIVDGQSDSLLAFIKNPGPGQSVTFLPLNMSGATAVDDTHFVPKNQSYVLLSDTSQNVIYRIDGPFSAGDAYSAGPTQFSKLTLASGLLSPVVSGMKAPHGFAFIAP